MKILKYWIPALFWMLVIFTLSTSYFSAESTEYVVSEGYLRHVAHIIEYIILSILVYFGFSNAFKVNNLIFLLLSFLISFFYSLSDEAHQYFVPGRHARWIDIGYDGLGIFLGVIILFFIVKVAKVRR